MPFEVRNTKFTVISSNHDLYNLIESEFQHEIPVEIKINKHMSKPPQRVDRPKWIEQELPTSRID